MFSGLNADEAAVAPLVFELHEASNEREEGVILALSHVFSGLVLSAALAHKNRTSVDELSAEALDSQPLSV